jgi:hypothetical protein
MASADSVHSTWSSANLRSGVRRPKTVLWVNPEALSAKKQGGQLFPLLSASGQ